MGLLSKMTGGPDKKLLATGLLGRGIITDIQPTGTTMESGNGLVTQIALDFATEPPVVTTPGETSNP